MPKSDVVLMWVSHGETNATLIDSYALGHSQPSPDVTLEQHGSRGSVDYHVISGVEINGRTIIEFYRQLITPDVMYDYQIFDPDSKINVIWSYHRSDDPLFGMGPMFPMHTSMGSNQIVLGNNKEPDIPDADSKSLTLTFNKFKVPGQETNYYCKPVSITAALNVSSTATVPPLHAIRVEPIIDDASVLHHMILYDCNKAKYDMNMQPFDCIRDMPACSFVFGWAVGGLPFNFPKDVGVPIGGDRAHNAFVLQVHYNNPNKELNHVDSSGFKIIYTPNLRKHDAGVMTLGLGTNFLRIPPLSNNVQFTDICNLGTARDRSNPNVVNNQPLVTKPFTVFAALLHMHQIGSKIYTEHYRASRKIGEIGRIDHYDFNMQRSTIFNDHITVQPNDVLITSCIYDNPNNRTVRGGAASSDEMCFSFVYYYPQSNGLDICVSGHARKHNSVTVPGLHERAPYVLVGLLSGASLLIVGVVVALNFLNKQKNDVSLLQ
jgi:hypothetical protein